MNKPDSTAAEQFLVTTTTNGDNPPYLKYAVSNGSVAYGYCYNETDAQKIVDALNNSIEAAKEAHLFAEWIGNSGWISMGDYKWKCIVHADSVHTWEFSTTAKLYNSEEFKRYKEGNK